MKLYIIRHADPDYAADSLTPRGWQEARLLAQRLARIPAAGYYVSPLGRAQATASLTLQAVGAQAQTRDWLREFSGWTVDEASGERRIPWDFLPQQWTPDKRYYDRDRWGGPLLHRGTVRREYRRVCAGLDELLAAHGYQRSGQCYRAVRPNEDTVMLFCHFGVECVLLSHLCGISPMVLWHQFVALPSSVTVLATEERRPGVALWRLQRFGDLSHLEAAGQEPSFAARFCETFANTQQRHD